MLLFMSEEYSEPWQASKIGLFVAINPFMTEAVII